MEQTTNATQRRRSPTRQCVVCRTRRPKDELVRLTKHPEHGVTVGLGERGPGRGAYLCREGSCWTGEGTVRRLEQALRQKLSDEDRQLLAAHASGWRHQKGS